MSSYGGTPSHHKPNKDLKYRYHYLGCPSALDITPYYDVVSIDPGDFMAIRVERRWPDKRIQTLWLDIMKIKTKDVQYQFGYWQIIEYLTQSHIYPLIYGARMYLIEWQMHVNYRTVRISQALVTFFQTINLQKPVQERQKCILLEIDPHVKSQVLGGPRGRDAVKRWETAITRDLLLCRGDTQSLEIMNKFKNSDDRQHDLSETILQTEAFCKAHDLPYDIDPDRCKQFKLSDVKQKFESQDSKISDQDLMQFLNTGKQLGLFNQ